MKKSLIVALAAGVALSCSGMASADPIQWKVEDGGNGHWYEAVAGVLSWDHANAAAQSRVWDGLRGHLVTITRQTEYEFLLGDPAFDAATRGPSPDQLGYWIGADGYVTGPASYDLTWVHNEGSVAANLADPTKWSISPWAYSAEPSGPEAEEAGLDPRSALHFFGLTGVTSTPLWAGWNSEGWNDVLVINRYGVPGYLVEYESAPEPATLLLLAGGLGGLAGFRFRRRRAA